jgi:hypothetical protein
LKRGSKNLSYSFDDWSSSYGASIILFDPLFQGLAISLVFGAIVSTILTLIVVPLIYYVTERKKWESSQGPSEEGDVETTKENIE